MDSYADGSGPIDNTQDDAAPDVYNQRLVGLRADHLAELQNPALRSFATRALLHEGGVGGLASNFEQLANYAHANNMGIKQALTSGFYGPVNNGQIQPSLSRQEAAAGDAAINSVFSLGRNKLAYRIDQGMQGDPNYNTEQNSRYRPARIDGAFFADHPSVGVGWAQKQLAADQAFKNGGGQIADQQYEAGNPIAAVNAAAGIKTPIGRGALSYAGSDVASNDDDEEEDTNTKGLGKGALQTLFQGDAPDRMHGIGAMLAQAGAALAGISNPTQGYVLSGLAKQITDNGKTDYQYMMGADGSLYRINKDDGSVSSVKTGSTKHQLQLKEITGANGMKIPGNYDPTSGAWTPLQGRGAAQGDNGLDENGLPATYEELQKQNPALANQVAQINSGGVKLPTSSYRNPQNMMIRNAVFKFFPGTSEDQFSARNAYAKNYGTDQPSQPGGQSVGLGHSLDIADQLGRNMLQQNNFSGLIGAGTTLNSIKNAQMWGGTNSATANAGGDLAYKLATETGRLYSGNQGGGVKEREDTMRRFGGDTQNLTPVQQAGLLREQRDVLTSRQEQLEGQRDKLFNDDPDAAKRFSFRDAKTQKAIDGINDTLSKLDPTGPEARALSLQNRAAPSVGGNRPPLASFF
jgi:hypothetical protein